MNYDQQGATAWLRDRVAAVLGSEPEDIAIDRPFMDFGLASAEGVAMIAAFGELLGVELSPALLWDCPDIESLVSRVCADARDERVDADVGRDPHAAIAIVGMACRYPGAPDVEAYWRLLERGGVSLGPVPETRWDGAALYHPDRDAPGRSIGHEGGFLSDLRAFDADFFGISPREAAHLDPRQRVVLELVWEAFEDAGVAMDSDSARATGTFAAVLNDDFAAMFSRDLSLFRAATGPGTANSMVANRVSHVFDLRGPSITVDTACSGSLVALVMACRSLRAGECGMAVAAGVNINLIPRGEVFFTKAGALSLQGRCRTFDADADGIVRSEGAGVVLLKPLAQALEDGDPVHAVILGEALNHDGRTNGVMAPSPSAQRALLTRACASAGIEPASVQWVEAHGTGTPLGDPIEVNAMTEALGRGRGPERPLVIGSVKANIGHSEAAAGMAGVIKVALAMRHGQIPMQPNFRTLNPGIERPPFPLIVPSEPIPWPGPGPRIAGVSGFGFGGANAHVLLGDGPGLGGAPVGGGRPTSEADDIPRLLPISARTPEGFSAVARQLAEVVERLPLVDVCHTLGCRRAHNKLRAALVVRDPASARAELAQLEPSELTGAPPRVALVFSGQGTHWPGMAADLLEDPVFLAAVEPAAELFELHGTPALLPLLREADALERTDVNQPLIFLVQLGLTRLLLSAGVEPVAVLGQSLGEVAAAHVAGALSLEDAVGVVFHRARLMQGVAGGGATAAIGLARDQAELSLAMAGSLDVAGVTSTDTTLISGPRADIEQLVAGLGERGVFTRILPGVDLAFHGRQMEPLVQPLMGSLAGVMPKQATIPMVSTLATEPLDGPELDGRYWATQLLRPFDLPGALARVEADVFVEVGPHAALQGALSQLGLRSLPSMRRGEAARPVVLGALAQLYAQGLDLDWRVLAGEGSLVDLPRYPWQREHHWLEELGGPDRARAPGRVRSLGADAQLIETLELSHAEPAWLLDHQVHGGVVMPGAAWATAAAAVGRELLASDVEVVELRFHRFLRVPAEGASVQLIASPEGPDRATFVAVGSERERFASAQLRALARVEPRRRDLDGLRRDCPRRERPEVIAEILARQGFRYGPSFSAIHELHAGEGQVLARLRLPRGVSPEPDRLHPILLDAAFRSSALVSTPEVARVPAGLERAWLSSARAMTELWCHVRRISPADGASLRVNIELLDARGELVASVDGFELSTVEAQSGSTGLFHALAWAPIEPEVATPPASTQSWALLGAPADLRAELERRGHLTASLGDAGEVDADRLVWVVDPNAELETLASTFLGLARRLGKARLSVLTSGAQAVVPGERCAPDQAGVWGLARVFANEHPERWDGIVDAVDVDWPTLVDALSTPHEDQLVARADGIWAARLRRVPLRRTPRPRLFRRDGSYLITGGFTGLGALTARWMVERGCRRLILAARSALPERHMWASLPSDDPLAARVALVRELEASGCAVHPVAVDVADPAQLEALLARHEAEGLPPLRGVVHSAGAVRDQLIWRMTEDDLLAVLAAKVDGARALDRLTRDLDFFVLYSSISSLLGRVGQANYAAANAYLDALASDRRARGLAGTVVNWGPWRDTGMFSGVHDDRGPVRALDPELGVELFDAIWFDALGSDAAGSDVGGGLAGCAVVDADWTRAAPTPMLRELQPQTDDTAEAQDPNELLALLLLEPEQRLAKVEAELRAQVSEILRTQPARVDVYATLFELGMDSLMVIELKRRAEATFGQALTMNDVFGGSVVQVARAICVALEDSEQLDELLSRIEAMPASQVAALLEASGE
ncbi:Phthiocerol/phenolphthiocerol synthesis polyketide synthase type I PpsA [Enhygromyxa salina]|uniref:Phthiocerol/phenolphthiocerol synthesis polyketide synthase type I PpsA n=1 Tax=Enhygromyxa salina TaxID=215803 RepID=A0A2S9XFI8_9BACT|nr:type I polyketide synthase [Enhygromyxa salina]PRP91638.1 Phthiocerol/phenolphthiocerol synthesis polyketide synthase type I PpsA [Enhygromyxa salina]